MVPPSDASTPLYVTVGAMMASILGLQYEGMRLCSLIDGISRQNPRLQRSHRVRVVKIIKNSSGLFSKDEIFIA